MDVVVVGVVRVSDTRIGRFILEKKNQETKIG